MNCPECGSYEARCYNSRRQSRRVYRRRACPTCGHRWTTLEVIVTEVVRIGQTDRYYRLEGYEFSNDDD